MKKIKKREDKTKVMKEEKCSKGTIHHTNEECIFFEAGRMNRIVPQTSLPDPNLSHRFLEEKTSAKIHYLRTSKQF